MTIGRGSKPSARRPLLDSFGFPPYRSYAMVEFQGVLLSRWSRRPGCRAPVTAEAPEMVSAGPEPTSRRPWSTGASATSRANRSSPPTPTRTRSPTSGNIFTSIDLGGQKADVHRLQAGRPEPRRQDRPRLLLRRSRRRAGDGRADLDFDGKFDHDRLLRGGKRVRDEMDMNFDQRADVWKYYEDEKLVRDRARHEQRRQGRRVAVLRGRQARSHRLRHDRLGQVDRWDRAPERDEDVPGGSTPRRRRAAATPPAATRHRPAAARRRRPRRPRSPPPRAAGARRWPRRPRPRARSRRRARRPRPRRSKRRSRRR